jgi:hypothetical protein
MVYTMIYMHIMPYWSILSCQGQGRMTYEGTRGSAIGQRYKGKHVLDIHLLKAKRHEAVLLQGHRLRFSDDADAPEPEWVTYQDSIPPCRFGNRAGATVDSSVGIGNWSRLYELNLCMWRYGLGQPCRVTVEEAEQRRRERLTEACKSTRDGEAATRRALHRGGCWGQGCSGRWMKRICYGIYHGIYIYHSIHHDIYQWYIQWYVLHSIRYIVYCVWYTPYLIT